MLLWGVLSEAPRGPDYAASMAALFKCGAAAMPLDGAYGRLRLKTVLSDAFPDILITSEHLNRLTHDFGGPRIVLKSDGSILASPGLRPGRPPLRKDAALVLYSGAPQEAAVGCVFLASSLTVLSRFYRHFFKLGPGESISVLQGPGSPEAVLGTRAALCSGARLSIPPEESRLSAKSFMEYAGEAGVSLALAPSALSRSLQSLPPPESLRALVASGERMGFFRPQPYSFYFSHGHKESLGGGLMKIVREQRAAMPLGKPFLGGHAWIAGRDGSPRPLGLPGEICLSGPLLAAGYLGREDETRKRFLPNPFQGDSGPEHASLLRTGEGGRLLPSGEIEEAPPREGLNFLGLSPSMPELEEALKDTKRRLGLG